MEWQLAILLALVSLVIIGFIYFDAKRRTRVRKERVERELYQERLEKSRDNTGFDDDGIGQVRVVGDELEESSEPLKREGISSELESETATRFSEEPQVEKAKTKEPLAAEKSTKESSNLEPTEPSEPVEPTISESDIPVLDDALFEFTKESLKKDQMAVVPPRKTMKNYKT